MHFPSLSVSSSSEIPKNYKSLNSEFGPAYEYAVPKELILYPLAKLPEMLLSNEQMKRINDFACAMVDNELDDYGEVISDLGDIMG